MLNSSGSSDETTLTLRCDGADSAVTPTPISTHIRQILARNLTEHPAGREDRQNTKCEKKNCKDFLVLLITPQGVKLTSL